MYLYADLRCRTCVRWDFGGTFAGMRIFLQVVGSVLICNCQDAKSKDTNIKNKRIIVVLSFNISSLLICAQTTLCLRNRICKTLSNIYEENMDIKKKYNPVINTHKENNIFNVDVVVLRYLRHLGEVEGHLGDCQSQSSFGFGSRDLELYSSRAGQCAHPRRNW